MTLKPRSFGFKLCETIRRGAIPTWTPSSIGSRSRERDEIEHCSTQGATCGGQPAGPMIDLPSLQEVSRQLWAFLGPLVASDATVHSVFVNCLRHIGLETWRRVAESINEDKLLILKDLSRW